MSDPQALVAEFLERAHQPILKALSAKTPLPKAGDRLAKTVRVALVVWP